MAELLIPVVPAQLPSSRADGTHLTMLPQNFSINEVHQHSRFAGPASAVLHKVTRTKYESWRLHGWLNLPPENMPILSRGMVQRCELQFSLSAIGMAKKRVACCFGKALCYGRPRQAGKQAGV